jgi:hypothetical protein
MPAKPRPKAAVAAITTIRIDFLPVSIVFAPIGNLSPLNTTADEQITTTAVETGTGIAYRCAQRRPQ